MPCAGAEGFLVMQRRTAESLGLRFARLLGAIERHNAFPDDPIQYRGGWALDRDELYGQAGIGPDNIDFLETYDDYPVINALQLEDLGFCGKGEGPDFIRANTFEAGRERFRSILPAANCRWGERAPPEHARSCRSDPSADRAGARRPRRRSAARPGVGLRHDQLRSRYLLWRQSRSSAAQAIKLVGREAVCSCACFQTAEQKNPIVSHAAADITAADIAQPCRARTSPRPRRAESWELQVCKDCDAVQYPPREICRTCLSHRLVWRTQRSTGQLLTDTPCCAFRQGCSFASASPWRIGMVRLDGGVNVVAYVHQTVGVAPCRVRIEASLDRVGQAALVAMPEHGRPDLSDDPKLREMTCDPGIAEVLAADRRIGGRQLLELRPQVRI